MNRMQADARLCSLLNRTAGNETAVEGGLEVLETSWVSFKMVCSSLSRGCGMQV